MAIVGTLLGATELVASAATVTVSATSTNGASWDVFVADTTGFGATPVTDNKGNTYTQIGANGTAFGVTGTRWRKENGAGGAGHIFTGTMTSSDLASMFVVEITGGATSSLLDQFQNGNDDVATPFTSAVTGTTTQANELVIAHEIDNRSAASAIVWGNSYVGLSDLSNVTGISCACAKLNVTATGTQQSSFTNVNTTESMTWIATFKELGGAVVVSAIMGRGIWIS